MGLENKVNDKEAKKFYERGKAGLVPTFFGYVAMAIGTLTGSGYVGSRDVYGDEMVVVTDGQKGEERVWIIQGERGKGALVKIVNPHTREIVVYKWCGLSLVNPQTGEKVKTIHEGGNYFVIDGKAYVVYSHEKGKEGTKEPEKKPEVKEEAKDKSLEKTLDKYRSLIREDPFNERYHEELREYLVGIMKFEKGAVLYHNLAIDFKADSPEQKKAKARLIYEEGMFEMERGAYSDAEKAVKKSIEYAPDETRYHYGLAMIEYKRALRPWIQDKPDAVRDYLQRALGLFEKVREMDSKFPGVNDHIAEISKRLESIK